MAAMFESCSYEYRSEHKIRLYRGTARNWRRCKFCGSKIDPREEHIVIHGYGELPGAFHIECAKHMAVMIKFAASGAVSHTEPTHNQKADSGESQ